MGLTADEARALTEKNSKVDIDMYVGAIEKGIKLYAGNGKCSLEPWVYLGHTRCTRPTDEEKRLIKEHFVTAGFKWYDCIETIEW